ncbi:MAG: hypothetical protein H7249_20155 [Chitinophagaceae bacterium]|nr:hypothetical protein [Oligoflexus sp.]
MDNRSWKKTTQILGVSMLLLTLSGCAFKRLIYDRLDWMVMWQLDTYLDLSKEQKLKFKPVVADAIAWVKKDQLPAAIVVISKLEDAAHQHRYDEGINNTFTHQIDTIRQQLFHKYEEPMVQFLLALDNEQIDYLKKKLSKTNEDLEDVLKEKNPTEEYQSVILKKSVKTLNEWYGDLTKTQVDAFHQAMQLGKPEIERRLKERSRIQDYIVDTLRSHDGVKVRTMLQSFGEHGEVWQDPVYLVYRNTAEGRWEKYLTAFHTSLSPEQWAHLEEKLKEMRGEIENMIGKSG